MGKFCYYLLTLKLLQTRKTFVHLQNKNYDIFYEIRQLSELLNKSYFVFFAHKNILIVW